MLYLDILNPSYIEKTPTTGITSPSDLNYLRRQYQFNYDAIVDYYESRNFSVKNTNILSRLVELFPYYTNFDSYRYVEYISDRLMHLAQHFRFTSSISKGLAHPGYFFGQGSEEIIIAVENPFDANAFAKNWKNEKAVSVLRHQRNDLSLLLPLGKEDGSKVGLSSIVVDVPKLAIQYREFIREQNRHIETGGIVLTKNHFVMKYVLPKLMDDCIDHSFLNMIMDSFYGNEVVTPDFKHRFKLFHPETQVKRYVEQTLKVITGKNVDYVNILRNIKLMTREDASVLLAIPDMSFTTQVKWGVFLSRIDHLIFLYDLEKSRSSNKHYLNDWSRLAKRIMSEGVYKDQFTYDLQNAVDEKLYKVSQF